MSVYDKTTFFYLQLQEDFFESDTIRWLESQDNGKEYVLIYLKLCLKSLKNNGLIVQQVGKVLIEYDIQTIANLVNANVDTTRVALSIFEKIGLIKVLEQGFVMAEIENLIGQKSKGAFKKQQQISRRNNQVLIEGGKKGGKKSTIVKDKDKVIIKDKCVLCQRNLKFKNNTCNTCWNFNECEIPYKNETINIALKEQHQDNTRQESIEDLEMYFRGE